MLHATSQEIVKDESYARSQLKHMGYYWKIVDFVHKCKCVETLNMCVDKKKGECDLFIFNRSIFHYVARRPTVVIVIEENTVVLIIGNNDVVFTDERDLDLIYVGLYI